MNLQYLSESTYLLPVCSRVLYARDAGLAISMGGGGIASLVIAVSAC